MAKKIYRNKKILAILTIIAVMAIGSAVYTKATQKPVDSPVGTTKHAGPDTDTTSPSPNSTAPTSNPDHPVSSTLPKPQGPNINVRTVSLSGSTGMISTCVSVVGASCYIQATKDGAIKQVSAAKTIESSQGGNGVALEWDAKQLSVGSWQIQAVASHDGQQAASDSQTLTVTP